VARVFSLAHSDSRTRDKHGLSPPGRPRNRLPHLYTANAANREMRGSPTDAVMFSRKADTLCSPVALMSMRLLPIDSHCPVFASRAETE
jgi:hypothetical protein